MINDWTRLQRGAVVRSVVFTTTIIARLTVRLPTSSRGWSLDKMLHDDYLCWVESGNQQVKEVRNKTQQEKRKK